MNEMSEMNLRRVGVSPYESECESPYQKVPIKLSVKCPYQNVPIKLSEKVPIRKSLSKCPYQNVHIKMSTSKYQFYLL